MHSTPADQVAGPCGVAEAPNQTIPSKDISLQWGPNISSGTRTVRLNIHVIQKSDHSGSFPSDLTITLPVFNAIIGWVNQRYKALQRCTLPASPTYVSDSKIQFRLTKIYFHASDYAWNMGTNANLTSPFWYNQFGEQKEKELNCFWNGYQDGNPACGSAPIASATFVNMLHAYVGNNPDSYWNFAQLLAHELAHSLGLAHTFDPDDVPDTAPEANGGWVPPDHVSVSNNIAAANNDGTYLSRMQLEKIHGFLRSTLSFVCDIRVAPPTPRGLALVADSPIFAVDPDGDLIRKFWKDGRWNTLTHPTMGFSLVPGSLLTMASGSATLVIGVTDRYDVAVFNLSGGGINPLQWGPGIVPGSLSLGPASDLFGVTLDRKLSRITVSGTYSTVSGSSAVTAGSLVPVNWASGKRLFWVNESFQVFSSDGTQPILPVSGVSAVPGSLIDTGISGLLGVDTTRQVFQVDWYDPSTVTGAYPAIAIEPGSLVLNPFMGTFGVTHGGDGHSPNKLARILQSGGISNPHVFEGLPDLVTGSLVNGFGRGLFGVTSAGDIACYRIVRGTMRCRIIPHWGGKVIPSSLVSTPDVDNGRAYGINENGEIVGTWLDTSSSPAGVLSYSIIE